MCGIVGHIGSNNSVEKVLEGLKRLEYRGYDSAGVCFKDQSGELSLYKKTGKLVNLTNLLKNIDYGSSSSSVGHTRWATHGAVNDINSHPHLYKNLAIVHNGIIENADELKKDLVAKGFKFKSETDTEVFLGLLSFELEQEKDLLKATSSAFKKIKGSSAFVIQSKDSDGIITVKNGAPLVCGVNEILGEAMVSSDPYALMGFVEKIFFPDDDVICFLKKGEINFYDLDGTPSNRYLAKDLETNFEATTKGQFEHYMLKEIYEQPALIRNLVDNYFKDIDLNLEKPKRLHIVGCGTAFYAGMVVGQIWEKRLKIPVSMELASEFRYKDPLLLPGDLAIFISQSGETADTLAAQKLCKDRGIKTFSIVNVEGSSLFRAVDQNFLIHAGQEIGVASTKAFTQQVLTGRIICEAFADNKDFSSLKQKFSLLSHRIDELLNKAELFKDIASKIYNFGGFFFTGRGIYYPVALEGALKLKEIAYVHAEGYAAGELKHGPIALIDERMVNIAIVGPELFEKTLSNIQEVKARKGVIIGIGPEVSELRNICDLFIPLTFEGLEELSPLYVNVANQLLSYHIAKHKGTDIDRPRNLAKSVTVE
ncbi:MAG: glutamine--fructose-6-phosphate transaminase (isomerizing) [Epsilonproteobacteria bacterium]|nr:MAG: glutamine--fructose-6-phosphate transaminase (isomerizing) [Campylobacterota bacterium]RLA67442.1 MAG: glutamine--fructose-6-phosphate transaminase (isomerizing) [Campylobacterota bacterium]